MAEKSEQACVVVGATGGIGSEVVRGLAKQGKNLVLVYRSKADVADRLIAEAEAAGVRAVAVPADVSRQSDIEKVIGAAMGAFRRIDVWVNLQGWIHELRLFHEESSANIERSIDIELRSVIYCCKSVIPKMIAQKGGRIITIGSDSGKVGSTGEAVSSACRGGVIAFSKALARELARHNITVNVVCPGPTDTALFEEMRTMPGLTQKLVSGMVGSIPMRRPATAREVAAAVLFLAAADSGYVTGQAISVSGGLTMC